MKRSLLNAWIAKLKSGDVEPLHGHMGSGTKQRCCLGVLADLTGMCTTRDEDNKLIYRCEINGVKKESALVLPENLVEYLKISTTGYGLKSANKVLTTMNDRDFGGTYADVIEALETCPEHYMTIEEELAA